MLNQRRLVDALKSATWTRSRSFENAFGGYETETKVARKSFSEPPTRTVSDAELLAALQSSPWETR